MDASSVRADDLLMLLAVARTGRYTAAAQLRGVDHTTVARRISALEDALGGRVVSASGRGWELTPLGQHAVETAGRIEAAMSHLAGGGVEPDPVSGVVRMSATDGFSAYIAAPAVAALRQRHPELSVEIVTAQRRAALHPGLDIEVVVGEPQSSRGHAVELGRYTLGLYASSAYLDHAGRPARVEDLEQHRLVYFVDSMLQVEALDLPRRVVPHMRDGVSSTNVLVQVEATRAGAGIGMLPCFTADRHDDLERLLPVEVSESLPYWMIVRADSLRIPAVVALADALREQTARAAAMLAGVASRPPVSAAREPRARRATASGGSPN